MCLRFLCAWYSLRPTCGCIALLILLCSPAASAAQPTGPVLHVEIGIADSGEATTQWLAMLRTRLADAPYDSAARIRKSLAPAERRWSDLIQSRLPSWERELPALASTFAPAAAPSRVTIVLGNRGAHDAFTHDATTIGFDLAALASAYGDAASVENTDRIDRLFRHEYAHLLQKAWIALHPYERNSPIRMALSEIWAEGIGNYYSMSDRWRASNGEQSAVAAETLAELAPRFAARLAALSCATPAAALELTKDLSWGRFDRKWGALTPALWLEAEVSRSPEALRDFILAGPDGVWALADRHLPATLRSVVHEARIASALCQR